MKKLIFLFAAISILSISNAQITFEYEYDTLVAPKAVSLHQIGDNYYRYIVKDYDNNQLILYNLNHSFDKTISIPTETGFLNFDVYFITQLLFDTDNLIEFMVRYYDSTGCIWKIQILNEMGSKLFEVDSTFWFDISFAGNDGYKLIVPKGFHCPTKYLSS